MICQKSEWFAWPPALLRTAVRIVLRHDLDLREHALDGAVGPLGAVERLVRVVDVGLVVLAVVDLHRPRVDVRLQRGVVVRQCGKLEGHPFLLVSTPAGFSQTAAERRIERWRSSSAAATSAASARRRRSSARGETTEQAFAIMDAAWALGLRWFDTADAYGGGRSETWIGEWIRATGNRPQLTTKTFNPMEDGADYGLARDRVLRQPSRASSGSASTGSTSTSRTSPTPRRRSPRRPARSRRCASRGWSGLRGLSNVERGGAARVARGRPAGAGPELVLAARSRRRGRRDPALCASTASPTRRSARSRAAG